MDVPTEQRNDSVDILIARAHSRRVLLENTFSTWRYRLDSLQSAHRRDEVVSGSIYENKLRYLFFRAWQWQFMNREVDKTKLQLAKKHRLRAQFRGWRRVVGARKEGMQRVITWVAECRPEQLHLKSRFQQWQRHSRLHLTTRQVQSKTTRALLHRFFFKWCTLSRAHSFQAKRRLLSVAVLNRTCGNTATALLRFHQWMGTTLQHRCRRLCARSAFCRFVNTTAARNLRSKTIRQFHQWVRFRHLVRSTGLSIMRHSFMRWVEARNFAVMSAIKEQIALKYFLGARFRHWKRKWETTKQNTIQMGMAIEHHKKSSMRKTFSKWFRFQLHRKFVASELSHALHDVRRDFLVRTALTGILSPSLGREAAVSVVKPHTSRVSDNHSVSSNSATHSPPVPTDDEETIRRAEEVRESLMERRSQRNDVSVTYSQHPSWSVASTSQNLPPRALRHSPRQQSPIPYKPFVDPMSGIVVGGNIHDGVDGVGMSSCLSEEHVVHVMEEYATLSKSKAADAAELRSLRSEMEMLTASMSSGTSEAERVSIQKQRSIVNDKLQRIRDRIQHRLSLKSRLQMMLPELNQALDSASLSSSSERSEASRPQEYSWATSNQFSPQNT